jgi:hypothetical protein
MSDQPPPKKRPGPGARPAGTGASPAGTGSSLPGTGSLGKDKQAQHLQGIAPAVVDAFLSAGGRKRDLEDGPEETRGLFSPPVEPIPVLTLTRSPESLGTFIRDADSAEVKSKFNKIKALAQAAREAPPIDLTLPDEPAAEGTGTGTLDPILAKRQKLPTPRPDSRGTGTKPLGTNPLGAGTKDLSGTKSLGAPNAKLQHLAMRAKAKGTSTGSLDKLSKTIEAAIGQKGALRLRESIKALEDKALPGKLTALAATVNRLMPEGSAHYAKLGLEVGKQVVQNNVNPFFAVSMALHEIGERLGELDKWDELSNKDRIANMAMITSNVAEILGAVTPPPVNYGIQVMGAGMLLMGMATEHSEAVEDLAKVAVGEKGAKVVEKGVNDASNQIANRVKNAWDELNDRLAAKKGKPRLPAGLQAMVDSKAWQSVKQHPVGARVTEGTENVLFNLASKREAFSASWDHRVAALRKLKGKKNTKSKPK